MAAGTHSLARFEVASAYQPLIRMAGLDADAVFDHPDIRVWRSLPERENCTLDVAVPDEGLVRLHIKRYFSALDPIRELAGIHFLEAAGVATVPFVGVGCGANGRGFLITRDLAGFSPADKLLGDGLPFDRLSDALADVAARLHLANLHHRDLYLCHFFVRLEPELEVRLIDAARVRRLPRWPLRNRWIVKDLAQLWYSALGIPNVSEVQRLDFLHRYADKRRIRNVGGLMRRIDRKARDIARHDARLNARQPHRNISIPQGASGARR
jgi:hypothetical protein